MKNDGFSSQDRARAQTPEEWLREYETGQPVFPHAWRRSSHSDQRDNNLTSEVNGNSVALTTDKVAALVLDGSEARIFRYSGYRTTRQGALAIEWSSEDGDYDAITWFNVNVTGRRGHGAKKKTGSKGYFYPERRSKFRKFWLRTFGEEPRRWGEVYKQMNKLSKFNFAGEVRFRTDSDGVDYLEATDLRVVTRNGAAPEHHHVMPC